MSQKEGGISRSRSNFADELKCWWSYKNGASFFNSAASRLCKQVRTFDWLSVGGGPSQTAPSRAADPKP